MSLTAIVGNATWSTLAQRARRRFRAALREPHATQGAVLARTLSANAATEFGRAADFPAILSARSVPAMIAAYQHRVPVRSYDEFDPFIARIAAGERDVLTMEPTVRLTPSSGSTAAAKLLPQTKASAREWSNAVDAWIADLYWRTPALLGGQAYWSITPSVSFGAVVEERFGRGARRPAVPIGFEDDSAYLGGVRQRLVDAVLAVPNDVRWVADPDAFRYVTLLFLLRARTLRLISVWHPSFLLQLLDALPRWFGSIVDDIARGTLNAPGALPPDVRQRLQRHVGRDPGRANELRTLPGASPASMWPHLSLVSCWRDGPAKPYAERLARVLPHATMQPKGLIATEGIVSIPFAGRHPLAIGSQFLEFIDGAGHPRLAHELSTGDEYEVVLTTAGGLYRYALGDRIRVTGWIEATPSIEFAGRADGVSDRFGEKLSDGFVTGVLSQIFSAVGPPRFAMLAPETTAAGIAYTLLVEPDGTLPEQLEASLERALRQNPHYAWCVDLGQLRPARVVRVGPHADRAYLDACVARGQRLGDVKPASLARDGGWEARLAVSSSS